MKILLLPRDPASEARAHLTKKEVKFWRGASCQLLSCIFRNCQSHPADAHSSINPNMHLSKARIDQTVEDGSVCFQSRI